MTRIILTRHGQTEWNSRPPRFRGRAELALSHAGMEQARVTGKRIRAMCRPRAVYTSPMGRCVVTGQIIAESLGLTTAESLAGLNDVDYGQWQGLTVEEVKVHWAEEFEKWSRTPHLAKLPHGETLQEVLARVSAVLRDILREHPRDTVVLVGHNCVNRVILLRALELALSRYRCLTQDHCAISELDFSNGSFRVKSLNETFHLQAAKLAWPRSSGKDGARHEGAMPGAQRG